MSRVREVIAFLGRDGEYQLDRGLTAGDAVRISMTNQWAAAAAGRSKAPAGNRTVHLDEYRHQPARPAIHRRKSTACLFVAR